MSKKNKLICLHIPGELLRLTDGDLGAEVRARMLAKIRESKERLENGRDSARVKMGNKITINGTTYLSRAQARADLCMSFASFAKKYPNNA